MLCCLETPSSQGGHHSGPRLTAQLVLPCLSPSQNTSPSQCRAPAGLHISLSLRQLLAGHPTILISPQLPLPLPASCPPGWQPQAKSSLPPAWHHTNPAWQPRTGAVLIVPKQGHSRIGIAASGRSFQPLTLISSQA